jgi:hypothetical protein
MPIIIGAGVGLVGGIGKMFERGRANRELRGLMKNMPQYKENPLFAQRLGLAQQLLNARMPGAAAAERNIYQTQANQMANVQRGATSGSDVLLAGAGAAGQAGQAFNQLGQMEAADYQRRYGNLASAQDAQAAEQQRVYEDQLRRYQTQAQLQGAIQENRAATFGDIGNLGMGFANMGVAGGFNTALAGKGMPTLPNTAPSTQAPISFFRNTSPGSINVPSSVTNYMANYSNYPLSTYPGR